MNTGEHPPAPAAGRLTGAKAGLGYGLLGLPLAFVALPLYVHLPHVYASRYGMPLATLGAVLLLARLLDAVTDPWLGHLSDRLQARSPRHVLLAASLAALLLVALLATTLAVPLGLDESQIRHHQFDHRTLLAVLGLPLTRLQAS